MAATGEDDWVFKEAEGLLNEGGRRQRLEEVAARLRGGHTRAVSANAARTRVEERIQAHRPGLHQPAGADGSRQAANACQQYIQPMDDTAEEAGPGPGQCDVTVLLDGIPGAHDHALDGLLTGRAGSISLDEL